MILYPTKMSSYEICHADHKNRARKYLRMFPRQWGRRDDKELEQLLANVPERHPQRWQIIANHLRKSPEEIEERYNILVRDIIEIDSDRVELPKYADDLKLDGQRKKGRPWTIDEHKRFLAGLEKYGKGDWRSIARNEVITRTATQVASHAQKYYLRQNQVKKERKRSSIHDTTTASLLFHHHNETIN